MAYNLRKRAGSAGTAQQGLATSLLDWNVLPQLAVFNVLKYLRPADRINAGKAHPAWRGAYQNQSLWRNLNLQLGSITRADVECIERFGHNVQRLQVAADTAGMTERWGDVLVKALQALAKAPALKLQSVQIKHTSRALPQRHMFVAAIESLLKRPQHQSGCSSDLIEIEIHLDDLEDLCKHTLHHVVNNHTKLQRLTFKFNNIYNSFNTDYNVSHIQLLIQNCRQLTHLDLSMSAPTLCDDVLNALGSADRQPLRFLSIAFPADLDDITGLLTRNAWRSFSARHPEIEVSLAIQVYDYDEDLDDLLAKHGLDEAGILNVTTLKMVLVITEEEFFGDIIEIITNMFSNSLTTCEWNFNGKPTPYGEDALVTFSRQCRNLNEFFLSGEGFHGEELKLSPETVAAILADNPLMQANNTYRLPSR